MSIKVDRDNFQNKIPKIAGPVPEPTRNHICFILPLVNSGCLFFVQSEHQDKQIPGADRWITMNNDPYQVYPQN